MNHFLRAAFLIVAVTASAFAQVPVYTNADLGKPPVAPRHVITPAEYQSLLAHQFQCACGLPQWDFGGGGTVAVAGFTTQPLPPTYPLQPPFYMSTYVGRGFRSGFQAGSNLGVAPGASPRSTRR